MPFIPHEWLYLLPGKALVSLKRTPSQTTVDNPTWFMILTFCVLILVGCNLVSNLLYRPFSPAPNSLLPESYDFIITIMLNDDLM